MWVDRVTIKTDSLQQSLWFRVIEREKQKRERWVDIGIVQEQVNDRALHRAFEFEFKVKDFICLSLSLFLPFSLSFSVHIMSAVERAKSAATPNSIITRTLPEKRDLP